MRRFLFVSCIAGALACGSVNDKQGCSVSTDCPVGQFCATGGGENHCWPDAVPPRVSSVTASCASPCLRDGVVHVEATVTDDNEVLDAAVSLDLDPSRTFPMTRSGAVWAADVPLRSLPFAVFATNVTPSVVARDGARNPSDPKTADAGIAVTRLKWTYTAGAPLTPPAVMNDGTTILGVLAGADQVLAVTPAGAKSWSKTLGATSFVTAAPAVGRDAIWVGSEDSKLYGLKFDGSAVLVNVDTLGAIKGSLAILTEPAKEWGFAANAGGRVCALSAANDFAPTVASGSYTAGPIIGLDGRVYAVTATATLKAFFFDGALAEKWTANVGVNVSAPIAVDAAANIWTGSTDAKLNETTPADTTGTVANVTTLSASIGDSPVVLSNGDVVVGDESGLLHRFSSAGVSQWAIEPNLGGAALAPMVLSGGSAALLVPTKAGTIHALRGDGTLVWSSSLAATELRAGNIFTPPGQTGAILSTAYFSGANGRLYAVIVDGQLDASAPWPKAFHDPKNTNHAGPQP